MRKKITIALLFVLSISFLSFNVKQENCSNIQIQDSLLGTYSDRQIKEFVKEVFGSHSDDLVFNSKSSRLKLFKNFLSRFKIELHPEYKGKNFNTLSEVELNDKYNKNLKRDVKMDVSSFNPLKYNFQMFSKKRQFFRFKNSDYIIIIDPVQ